MLRLFIKISILIALSGCMDMKSKAISSSSKGLINDEIREINLMKLGNKKYNLQIRGNIYSSLSDLRNQFNREVNAICKNGYEITQLDTSDVAHSGIKKPLIEGDFLCK